MIAAMAWPDATPVRRLGQHIKTPNDLGGQVVAGTDTGNPYRFAGFALHEELASVRDFLFFEGLTSPSSRSWCLALLSLDQFDAAVLGAPLLRTIVGDGALLPEPCR